MAPKAKKVISLSILCDVRNLKRCPTENKLDGTENLGNRLSMLREKRYVLHSSILGRVIENGSL